MSGPALRQLLLILSIVFVSAWNGGTSSFAQAPPVAARGFESYFPAEEVDSPSMPSEELMVDSAAGDMSGIPYQPVAGGVAAHVPAWQWKFLPQGFLYHTYLASTPEPRLSTQLFKDLGGGSYLDTSIAGRFGIVRFGRTDIDEGWQLDLLGGAKLRQNVDHEMDMTGTDYRIDIPLTYRYGQHGWKFGFYHISSHVGDEFLLNNPGFDRLNFERNAFYLGYSYYATPNTRWYGEIDLGIYNDYSEPLNLQFGFEWAPNYPTGTDGAPFFAINGSLRQELDFGGNVNIEAGWAWRGEGRTAGLLRTGPYFYNGGSPQFSFYANSEQQLGWGIWYDY